MEGRIERLLIECSLVERVAENSQREDRECQRIATVVRRAKDLGQEVSAVLCSLLMLMKPVGKSLARLVLQQHYLY